VFRTAISNGISVPPDLAAFSPSVGTALPAGLIFSAKALITGSGHALII